MTIFCGLDFKEYLHQLGESSTGHNKLTLLKEIIDNSLDANATIIKLFKKESSIIIQDNGDGMDTEALFRCIQFYSKNQTGKTGKFGIGGSTALVNLCKSNNIFGTLFIFTKNRRGETLSLHIDWEKYQSMSDFEKAVNSSLTLNCVSDSRLLDDFEHGTYIKFDTNCDMIEECFEEINSWINLSISYYYFLEKGVIINIFGEDLRYIQLKNTTMKETIEIDIYKHKKKYGYSSKYGRQTICYRYDKQTTRAIKCGADEIDHWELIGQLSLTLICPDIYNGSLSYKKNLDVTAKIPEVEEYCREMDVDEQDVLQCQKEYIMPIYIARKAIDTTRILGGLTIQCPHNNIYKELLFDKKYDDSLGLVQQNKSCIEWNNSPPYLQEYLEHVIQTCINNKLIPIYKNLDKQYKEKKKEQERIVLFIDNHIQKCPLSDRYNPYLLEDIISATTFIQNAYSNYYWNNREIKQRACTTIIHWYSKWKDLYQSGELKMRKFFIWASNYYQKLCAIKKIQRLCRLFLHIIKDINRKYKAATIITQRLARQWSSYKYMQVLIIQTTYRRYKIHKQYIQSYKRIKKQLKLNRTMQVHHIDSIQKLDELRIFLNNFRKTQVKII